MTPKEELFIAPDSFYAVFKLEKPKKQTKAAMKRMRKRIKKENMEKEVELLSSQRESDIFECWI